MLTILPQLSFAHCIKGLAARKAEAQKSFELSRKYKIIGWGLAAGTSTVYTLGVIKRCLQDPRNLHSCLKQASIRLAVGGGFSGYSFSNLKAALNSKAEEALAPVELSPLFKKLISIYQLEGSHFSTALDEFQSIYFQTHLRASRPGKMDVLQLFFLMMRGIERDELCPAETPMNDSELKSWIMIQPRRSPEDFLNLLNQDRSSSASRKRADSRIKRYTVLRKRSEHFFESLLRYTHFKKAHAESELPEHHAAERLLELQMLGASRSLKQKADFAYTPRLDTIDEASSDEDIEPQH